MRTPKRKPLRLDGCGSPRRHICGKGWALEHREQEEKIIRLNNLSATRKVVIIFPEIVGNESIFI